MRRYGFARTIRRRICERLVGGALMQNRRADFYHLPRFATVLPGYAAGHEDVRLLPLPHGFA